MSISNENFQRGNIRQQHTFTQQQQQCEDFNKDSIFNQHKQQQRETFFTDPYKSNPKDYDSQCNTESRDNVYDKYNVIRGKEAYNQDYNPQDVDYPSTYGKEESVRSTFFPSAENFKGNLHGDDKDRFVVKKGYDNDGIVGDDDEEDVTETLTQYIDEHGILVTEVSSFFSFFIII